MRGILEEPIKEVVTLRNFVGGEHVESRGELVDVVNPATCKVIAKVPISTAAEINEAVEAAKGAYPDKLYRSLLKGAKLTVKPEEVRKNLKSRASNRGKISCPYKEMGKS